MTPTRPRPDTDTDSTPPDSTRSRPQRDSDSTRLAFWNTIGNHIGGCHVHYPIMLLTTPSRPPIIGALGVGLFPQACVGGTVVWFGLEQWLMLVRSIVVVGHYPGHPHSSPGQNPWLPTHGL